METVLVLGASGFIGHHLITRLLKTNRVIGYSRRIPIDLLTNSNYTHLTGDFAAETSLDYIFDSNNISCVYHCISTTTPKVGTAHVIAEAEENILSTLRLLDTLSKYPGVRLVFISSGGTIYGEYKGHPWKPSDETHPICTYGMQKKIIEEYIHYYRLTVGLDGRIMRISNPYGIMAQIKRTQGIIPIFLNNLQQGKGITLFGDTVRDYIHIDDVIDALAAVKDYHGQETIFNIGSGEGIHLSHLVEIIKQVTGKEFDSVSLKEIRACDVQANILDCAQSSAELGWRPHIQLQDGIRRVWNELNDFHLF